MILEIGQGLVKANLKESFVDSGFTHSISADEYVDYNAPCDSIASNSNTSIYPILSLNLFEFQSMSILEWSIDVQYCLQKSLSALKIQQLTRLNLPDDFRLRHLEQFPHTSTVLVATSSEIDRLIGDTVVCSLTNSLSTILVLLLSKSADGRYQYRNCTNTIHWIPVNIVPSSHLPYLSRYSTLSLHSSEIASYGRSMRNCQRPRLQIDYRNPWLPYQLLINDVLYEIDYSTR